MGRRSCMVNENKIIYIDFGSVGLKKISTKEAIKPIDYVLNCSGANEANSVEMTLKAISIPGHPATMQASQLGLWLTFINSENEQNLNESFSVRDWHNPPKLEIRLDKDPSVALQATSFTAVATLIAEYF